MDWFGITVVIGLASLAISGIVALTHPIENSGGVAIRVAVVGVVLIVGSVIIWAITNGVR